MQNHALALPLSAAPLCANHDHKFCSRPSNAVSSRRPLSLKLILPCPVAPYLYIGLSSQVQKKSHLFKVRAVPSVPENASENADSRGLLRNMKLGAMVGVWFLLNVYFNFFNKQVLKICPFPATITTFQFGCGTLMISIMWVFNLHKRPKVTRSQLAAIILLAIGHTSGNLLTNVSLAKVNVSFTHTVKAMEPFFTVLFSALILGEQPAFWVVASLMPIVGGVALASFTEGSFNWVGFSSAMASNMTNQSRNVLSKKLMAHQEEALDNVTLFSVVTVLSFIFLVPVALVLEGGRITPYLHSATNQRVREVFIRSIAAGVCQHSYQQVSYMILEKVSPVTHSVANCLKRVVVIVSSVIFFKTPVSPVNSLGTALALGGVFLYSRAKRTNTRFRAA